MENKQGEIKGKQGSLLVGILMLGILFLMSFALHGVASILLSMIIIAISETICRLRFQSSLVEMLFPFRRKPETSETGTENARENEA